MFCVKNFKNWRMGLRETKIFCIVNEVIRGGLREICGRQRVNIQNILRVLNMEEWNYLGNKENRWFLKDEEQLVKKYVKYMWDFQLVGKGNFDIFKVEVGRLGV